MTRTPLVVVPLVVLLVATAGLGARMLLAEPDRADASGGPATCWDGSTSRTGVDGCSRPRGLAGLAWVFPSIDLDDQACSGREDGRTATWRCRVRVEGVPTLLRYVAARDTRTSLARARRMHAGGDRTEARAPDGSVNRVVWRSPDPDAEGRMSLTSAYRGHPYSVTVVAGTQRARDRALRTLVEHRDPADVRGVPAG